MQKFVILKNYDPVVIVLENSDDLCGDPQKEIIFENSIFFAWHKKTGDFSPVLIILHYQKNLLLLSTVSIVTAS